MSEIESIARSTYKIGDHHLDYRAGKSPFDGKWTCRRCKQSRATPQNFRILRCSVEKGTGR